MSRLSKNQHRAKALRLERALRARGRSMGRTLDVPALATALDAFSGRLREVLGLEAAGVTAGVGREPVAASAAIAPDESGAADGARVVTPASSSVSVPTGSQEGGVRRSNARRDELETPSGRPPVAPRASKRDPRLGRWHDVGAFLMNVRSALKLTRSEVMAQAGFLPGEDGLRLLEHPGGLERLYVACANEARRKQQRVA